MKVAISQKTLLRAIEKGGMAALSEEAQSDTSNRSLLIKSVHIKIDTDLTISSASSLIASKLTLPISKDNGIEVKEAGEVVVPAKDLIDWVSRQPSSSQIGLVLKKLDTPELINVVDSDVAQDSDKNAVRRIGTVQISSKDSSKTGAKWSLNSYDPDQLPLLVPVLELGAESNKLFTIKVEKVSSALNSIKFAAEKKHYQHLYDSVAFYAREKELYALTTDRTRVATYKLSEVSDLNIQDKMLVPIAPFSQFLGLSDGGDEVSIYYDSGKNRVFAVSSGFVIRMSTAEQSLWPKIPSIDLLFKKHYKDLGSIPKGILASRLDTISLLTKGSALFSFGQDSVVIFAQSESSPSPMLTNAPVASLQKEFEVSIPISSLQVCLKTIKDEDVFLGLPDEDENSMLISSKEDENFHYYMMVTDKSKLIALKKQVS